MCGRFSASKSSSELQAEFNLSAVRAQAMPSFNIAPTRHAPVVINDGARALDVFRWGLIPFWAKDAGIGAKTINARAESLAEKPAFRDAFKLRRCLVLADGFYEWKVVAGRKVPHFIRLKGGNRTMTFAGLWETWRAPEGNEVRTCTIVTTAPNEFMVSIHDRMPVILSKESLEAWLDPHPGRPEDLSPLLSPCPSDWLEAFPVSAAVNSPKNDGPELVRPAEVEAPAQASLF